MKQGYKNREVDIKITTFSKKGNGLGITNPSEGPPLLVEIPFTMPGDVVRARLLRKKGAMYCGKLEEIVTPSKNRIQPRCVHFGVCGGCRLQHLSYEQQLKYKEEMVRECFQPLLTPQVSFRPIIPCSDPWNYRNKMEYTFSKDASGKKFLGLVIESTDRRVFNLSECHLTNPWFVDALKAVRQWWLESGLEPYRLSRDTGSLRTLTLREGQRTGDRMAILTVSGNPEFSLHRHHLESFVAFLRDAVEPVNPQSFLSIFLRIQQIGEGMATNIYEMKLYGPDHIREVLEITLEPEKTPFSVSFDISPSAFFQPNTRQAEKLYSAALSMANISKDSVVYDLYCGTGALGICLAKRVKQVIGVELRPESALDARNNAKRNECSNVTIVSGAVRYVLGQIEERSLPSPDVVMVDPPRPGLDPQALKHLLQLKAPKILYVSCNPHTQAGNIAELLQNGYKLTAVQPVDQFPHTYHVENVAVLERS